MFMWGPAPIRRTLPYLKAGTFFVRNNIKIMEVQYHLHGRRYQTREEMRKDQFSGLREFYFWEMARIQYQNPNLQIVRFLDKLPSPFIRFFYDDGSEIVFDCFGQTHIEILDRLKKTVGKSKERLRLEAAAKLEVEGEENPALFGYRRERFCGCEVMGQSPCPGVIRRPRFDQYEFELPSGKVQI